MPRIEDQLPRIIHELQPAVDTAVKAAAEMVAESAKVRVPVRTGALRNAIHLNVEPEGVYVVAGNRKAWYGHIVEHGGAHTPPHPFLIPALEEHRAQILEAVRLAVRKVT